MSTYAIKTFHSDLERLKHFGGTSKETAIRFAFQKLLDEYAKSKDLMLIPEISLKTRSGKTITPDGTLKDMLRLDHGYWESKDEADNIDEEIQKKFAKNYPNDNIIFEDSNIAVLIQHGQEVMRTSMQDEEQLDKLLIKFVSFERKEITDFRQAIDKFREDIPKVTETLHGIIETQFSNKNNFEFETQFAAFHEMAKQSINPDISEADIKEMMVQHILSADIFNTIFDEPHFHQENNIARELNKVIETFFTGITRRTTLGSIQHYYQTINAAAAAIIDHHEKQKFLKVVYENFYKAYNPKAADRLGIVYTPNEIVQFMIKSTDYLLHKHFNKTLADKNVDILDPATGTGTFICDIIDFLPKNKLEWKYKHELHANELAILPYYIANLNIEYTYKQKMGSYNEFENLCLVDTLDNTGFNWIGKQGDLFGVSAENAKRIKKQNERKISVIIGNPPYNANQQNENDNNKNRTYKEIDNRIKDTFIKNSKAQKTKLYDMYSRFYRWAMDRLNENGIIAFITNRSFIDSRTFDGFRKSIQVDYDYAYIIDTKSDVRANPKIAGTTHNVFGIQTGVAILFLIKTSTGKLKDNYCRIYYTTLQDEWRKEVKLQWFAEQNINQIEFEKVNPDKNNNWLNISENDWETLLPLYQKDKDESIFNFCSNGVSSNRDEWVYDFDQSNLGRKIHFFIDTYNELIANNSEQYPKSIKWSSTLKSCFKAKRNISHSDKKYILSSYRPFTLKVFYADPVLNDRLTENHLRFFGKNFEKENTLISINASDKGLIKLTSKNICDLHFTGDSKCLPLYRYDNEEKIDNISNWGLQKFSSYYNDNLIKKENIFHYIYAILHHPSYQSKYELNLKRDFPRIPFYDDFWKWANWGKCLVDLHTDYEKVEPYALEVSEKSLDIHNLAVLEKLKKPKLRADKVAGTIELDGLTILKGVPSIAWEYKLGNRSAIEWILDQYKEKKPSDKTIEEKFNKYVFSEYKHEVINLLTRVCTVSIETMKIIDKMPK